MAWWKDFARGVGSHLLGGGRGGMDFSGGGYPTGGPGGMPPGGMPGAGMPGVSYPAPGAAAAGRPPMTVTRPPAMTSELAATYGPAGSGRRGGGVGSRILSWLGDNPEIALGAAGVGANIYGAHKMGQAEDRRADLDEEEMRRRWEEEERERERKQRAYRSILARRGGG